MPATVSSFYTRPSRTERANSFSSSDTATDSILRKLVLPSFTEQYHEPDRPERTGTSSASKGSTPFEVARGPGASLYRFMNQSYEGRPYLGTFTKLAHICLNKFKLIAILVIVYLTVVTNVVQSLLGALGDNANRDYQSYFSDQRAQASKDINALIAGNFNAAVSNLYNYSASYANVLAYIFGAMSEMTAHAQYDAARNATASVNEWTRDALNETANSLSDELQGYYGTLNSILEIINSSQFASDGISNVQPVSLNGLTNFSAPTEVNSRLEELNSTNDFGFRSLAAAAQSSLSHWKQKHHADANLWESISAADKGNRTSTVTQYCEQMKGSVEKYYNGCAATVGVLAVVIIIPYAFWERYRWQQVWHSVRELETQIGIEDRSTRVHRLFYPTVEWVSDRISSRCVQEKDRIIIKWIVAHALSPLNLSVIGTGSIVLVTYILQLISFSPLLGGDDEIGMLTIPGYNATKVNNVYDSAVQDLANILSSFQTNMTDRANNLFNRTDLSGLSWSSPFTVVAFASPTNSYERSFQAQVDQVVQLRSAVNSFVLSHLEVGMSFLGFWILSVIGICAFAYWRNHFKA
uniref:Plasma membrane fusion protein PRM1 n=1 Tax=Blastobotrys adeninivorans TaxID=409370 RepID=A0A060T9Y5_BLAAD